MKQFHFIRPAVCLLLAGIMMFALAACGQEPKPEVSSGETGQSEVSKEEISKEPEKPLNLLTGRHELDPESVGKRPVSFMINNIQIALPQYGIGDADIIFEALAEGGITRLLAVFPDPAKLPAQVGPIRSARDYYLDFAAPSDAIFVNWGTSNIAAKAIRERHIDNIDGMYYSNYYYTDLNLAHQKGWEHSRFMRPDGLAKVLKARNQRVATDNKQTYFKFRDEKKPFVPADQSVIHLQARFSYSYDATFDYNEKTMQYEVSEFGKPHMDNASKKQLAFDNVLVLFTSVRRVGTKDGKVAVGLEEGNGIYVSRGGGMSVRWHKGSPESHFTFQDQNGVPVELNAGTTYVCVVPLEQQQNTVIKGAEKPSESSAAQQG